MVTRPMEPLFWFVLGAVILFGFLRGELFGWGDGTNPKGLCRGLEGYRG